MEGNLEVRLLTRKNAWNEILNDIGKETERIRYQTFLWRDDSLGQRVAETLLGACERGCKVAVVYDTESLPHAFAEFVGKSFWDTWYSTEPWLQLKASLYALSKGRVPIVQVGNPLRRKLLH